MYIQRRAFASADESSFSFTKRKKTIHSRLRMDPHTPRAFTSL